MGIMGVFELGSYLLMCHGRWHCHYFFCVLRGVAALLVCSLCFLFFFCSASSSFLYSSLTPFHLLVMFLFFLGSLIYFRFFVMFLSSQASSS